MGSETNVGRGQTDLAATPVTGRLAVNLRADSTAGASAASDSIAVWQSNLHPFDKAISRFAPFPLDD